MKELEVSNQEKRRHGEHNSCLQTLQTALGREIKIYFLWLHKGEPTPSGSSRERNFSSTELRMFCLQQIREKEPDWESEDLALSPVSSTFQL